MPHFIVEYSANVEEWIDMSAFCDALRRVAVETGVFPLAGVRVRAIRCAHYSIADGNPENGFVDISVRLRGGRTLDVRKRATKQIFEAAKEFLFPVLDTRAFALSLEMRNIEPELSPKESSIREHLKARTS